MTPVTEAQKSVKVTISRRMKKARNTEPAGLNWKTPLKSPFPGPKDCLPAWTRQHGEGKTVSIWLKPNKADCSNEQAIAYSTIEDSKDIEKVDVYEAGYSESFPLFKK